VALRDAVGDALALSEIREHRGLTQVDVARVMQTSQASVSKLERREDLYLSTLRGFVEALGGKLELSAVFPEGRIAIANPAAFVRDLGADPQRGDPRARGNHRGR
jgi:transcriptional regulator with XRE-family HTH domain